MTTKVECSSMRSKPASKTTRDLNHAVQKLLDFGDRRDFEDARRGFVAALEPAIIKGPDGQIVWDMEQYAFLDAEAPDSVNPSLWRQAQLNKISGLFTIHPRIHQVRGHDLSNMTLVQGDTGWIVIDPLTSVETARASLQLANDKLGARPVVAVIYTHSHADHFGGVRSVIDEADVKAGRVPVIAPDGFLRYAVSENIMAGNAMNRRALAMYGAKLEASPFGHICCGLGKAIPKGTVSMIAPTDIVSRTGETRRIDGVDIEFQMANGSEAPAEFMFYFHQFRALCASEVTSHHMHNVLTPREPRSATHSPGPNISMRRSICLPTAATCYSPAITGQPGAKTTSGVFLLGSATSIVSYMTKRFGLPITASTWRKSPRCCSFLRRSRATSLAAAITEHCGTM